MSDKARASGVFIADIPPLPTISPTAPPTQTPAVNHVLITELSTRSDEWIELYNPTTTTISLSNWSIRDNSTNAPDSFLGTSSLPSGGFAIILGKGQAPPLVPIDTIIIEIDDSLLGNGLTDAGDKIELYDSASVLVDAVSYGNVGITGFTPPLPNPIAGQTYARVPINTDTDTSSDWVIRSSRDPGAINKP
ncbi:MAG: hypothetical protein UZ21_OP11001000982 [Microgenomates bacterium OLB22]|nr:MAG: hypothetical protein UZ21_OP11001000982 [Microgenomates bacterium OLB22]